MSRVEIGYVDFLSRSSGEGRLTFFRTSAGRGRALLTLPGVRERIWQPSSFSRACDQIADAQQILRAYAWNEFNMHAIVSFDRTWQVESISGDIIASGKVLDVFDAPHEVVHGLTVTLAAVAHPTVEGEISKHENVNLGSTIAKGFRIDLVS